MTMPILKEGDVYLACLFVGGIALNFCVCL